MSKVGAASCAALCTLQRQVEHRRQVSSPPTPVPSGAVRENGARTWIPETTKVNEGNNDRTDSGRAVLGPIPDLCYLPGKSRRSTGFGPPIRPSFPSLPLKGPNGALRQLVGGRRFRGAGLGNGGAEAPPSQLAPPQWSCSPEQLSAEAPARLRPSLWSRSLEQLSASRHRASAPAPVVCREFSKKADHGRWFGGKT